MESAEASGAGGASDVATEGTGSSTSRGTGGSSSRGKRRAGPGPPDSLEWEAFTVIENHGRGKKTVRCNTCMERLERTKVETARNHIVKSCKNPDPEMVAKLVEGRAKKARLTPPEDASSADESQPAGVKPTGAKPKAKAKKVIGDYLHRPIEVSKSLGEELMIYFVRFIASAGLAFAIMDNYWLRKIFKKLTGGKWKPAGRLLEASKVPIRFARRMAASVNS